MFYRHNSETIQLAKKIIEKNASFDDGYYSISSYDVDEFDRQELASLIMKHDESYASEATGPDNKHYDRMALTLRKFLENPHDKEAQYAYNETWLECVTDYFKNTIDSLIEWQLDEYNSDKTIYENIYASHGMSERDFR